jgi:uncharacterized glyoxalase superfamily protein PhnB
MPSNPPEGTQRIVPYLYYEDGAAQLEFLCTAFGFEERMAIRRGDDSLMHAELSYEGNVVMLATPVDESGTPWPVKDTAGRSSSVMCYVDDVDAHYARARAAGAEIVQPLEDKPYGDRMYTAADPEGHHWHFSTHLRDVSPEDLETPA